MSMPHCNQNRPVASQESRWTLEYCATLHPDTSPVKVSHKLAGVWEGRRVMTVYV